MIFDIKSHALQNEFANEPHARPFLAIASPNTVGRLALKQT